MDTPEFLDTPQGRRLAYHRTDGAGPMVVFLGGLRSDMTGTKALHLEAWARATGRAFLRFDYSGHGESSGTFEEGCIGDWAEDVTAALSALAAGPLVLVGSSMGGWQALLAAREAKLRLPESLSIIGLVTIAAAPDYTEDAMWASFTTDQRSALEVAGQVALASDYGADLIVTRRMIEDGRLHLVLRSPLALPMPVRMLQGTADEDVEMAVALRLLDHAEGPDIRLTLVKGADHRFSTQPCLDLIVAAIEEVSG